MHIRVRMLGTLREAAGSHEKALNLPGEASVSTVIQALIDGNRGLEDALLDPVLGSPVPNALILLDGVEVNNLQGLDTEVREGSELVILSVTHGG